METTDATTEVLKIMAPEKPRELPSYEAAAAKRASEALGEKMDAAARQGVRDSLEKAFGSAFHSQIATQPENHLRADQQTVESLPTVETRRPLFQPRAIAPATVRPGESGLQAAMARLRRESEDAKLRNTQQTWPKMNPNFRYAEEAGAPCELDESCAEAARKSSDALPGFIVKVGRESLRCERCGINFPAMQFGPNSFTRAKKHIKLCHTEGSMAESLGKSALTHDFASTLSRRDSSDLAKSRPF